MSRRHPRKPKKNENGNANTKPIKWTAAFVRVELESMLTDLVANSTTIFIGTLFEKRPYSRARFSEWAKKFEALATDVKATREVKEDADHITEMIRKIEEICEARCADGAIRDIYNSTYTKFHMVNNHGYKDKTEAENTVKVPTLATLFDAAAQRRANEEEV